MDEERKNPALINREVLTNIDLEIQNTSFSSERHLNLLGPLRPLSKEEIEHLRLKFRELGFNVDDLTEEDKNSLRKNQFRGRPGDYFFFEKGRGPAMVDILGEEKIKKLIDFCYETAIDSGWEEHKIGGHEKTQGRGLQQTAVDLFSLAVFGEKEQTIFINSINQRILKGLRIKYKDDSETLVVINKKFEGVPEPQEPSKIASVPPGTLWKVWRYLINITP